MPIEPANLRVGSPPGRRKQSKVDAGVHSDQSGFANPKSWLTGIGQTLSKRAIYIERLMVFQHV